MKSLTQPKCFMGLGYKDEKACLISALKEL